MGTAVLSSFGNRVSAFRIAGGLPLGFSGLSLLNATEPGDSHEKDVDGWQMTLPV